MSDQQGAQEEPQKRRRCRLPTKNMYPIRQQVEFRHHGVRPIPYRKKIKSIVQQQKEQIRKRTRVTRNIKSAPIQQFHLENDKDTVLENVPVLSLAQTVKNLVDDSKVLYPDSEAFYDDVIPTAVEYDGSVKMFHFGMSMKKHSCKQKRSRFQTCWWRMKKKASSGFVPFAVEPSVRYNTDKNLFEQHAMSFRHSASQLQKVIKKYQDRLNRRRTDNNVIRDSAYFVREFFLMKSAISLRINRAVDIPDCFVPPTLECGYFPLDATTVRDKKHYLAARYQEAQMEYLSLTTRSIEPSEGFTVGTITASELYSFHEVGRHIHGFYQVWESSDGWFEDHDGTMRKYRYLVDIFNFIRFPLYIPYDRWDQRLRVSFDRNSVFLLHLTEIIRINRPIFNCLAQNKSLYQPITLREMCELMTAHEVTPKYFVGTCGYYEFYDWARGTGNAEYLSAYCMIVGGSKTMKDIKDRKVERHAMLETSVPREHVLVGRDSKVYPIRTDVPVKQTFLREDFEDEEVVKVIRSCHEDPGYQCETTRFIIDIPKLKPEAQKPAALVTYKKPFEVAYSRRRLMQVRRKIYNLPAPPPAKPKGPPAKKKPGRKAVPKEMKLQQKYDFVETVMPSDIESDFDEYISDGEDLMDEHMPMLKRSMSAESVFMDSRIRDIPLKTVSWFHQRAIRRPVLQQKEKRVQKLKRMYRKHGLRYKIINAEEKATNEMVNCYHGKMERLSLEIKNTKIAVRLNSYRHYNIPKVFVRGDGPVIDDCANALRSIVTVLVAKETANTRITNALSNQLSIAIQHRRTALLQLPKSSRVDLPRPVYISMELLTMKRMNHRSDIEDARAFMRAHSDWKMDWYKSLPLDIVHQRTENAKRDRQRVADEGIAQFRVKKEARLERIAEMERMFGKHRNAISVPAAKAVQAVKAGRKRKYVRRTDAEKNKKRKEAEHDQELIFEVEKDWKQEESGPKTRQKLREGRQKAEAEQAEADRLAKQKTREEAKKKADEAKRAEAEQAEADRLTEQKAREKARQKAEEAEQLAMKRAEEARKLEADQVANIEQEKQEEAVRLAEQKAEEAEARKKAEAEQAEAYWLAEQKTREEAGQKAEAAEQLAMKRAEEANKLEARKKAEEKQAEAERLAEQKAEEEARTMAKEAEQLAMKRAEEARKLEAERVAKVEQEKKAEADRVAKQKAEKEEEARKKAEEERAEAQRLAEQNAEEEARQKANEAEQLTMKQTEEARKLEAERVAKVAREKQEEAVRLAKQKAEEEAKKKAEAAQAEAERLAKQKAREEAEKKADEAKRAEAKRAEANRLAEQKAEGEAQKWAKEAEQLAMKRAKEARELEAERVAKVEREKQKEAVRLAKQKAEEEAEARKKAEEKRAEAERLAEQEAEEEAQKRAKKAEQLAMKRAEEARELEAERVAKVEREKKAEADRLAKKKEEEETARKKADEAKRAEADRLAEEKAREEARQKAEEAEQLAKEARRLEAERVAQVEREKKAHGFRALHLRFVQNPGSFDMNEPGFREGLKALAEEQLCRLKVELERPSYPAFALTLKCYTQLLLDFLASPPGTFYGDSIRLQIISLAYMDGSQVQWEQLAECAAVVVGDKKKQFAERVLQCSQSEFEAVLTSPLDHLLIDGGRDFPKKIILFLMCDYVQRKLILGEIDLICYLFPGFFC